MYDMMLFFDNSMLNLYIMNIILILYRLSNCLAVCVHIVVYLPADRSQGSLIRFRF